MRDKEKETKEHPLGDSESTPMKNWLCRKDKEGLLMLKHFAKENPHYTWERRQEDLYDGLLKVCGEEVPPNKGESDKEVFIDLLILEAAVYTLNNIQDPAERLKYISLLGAAYAQLPVRKYRERGF